MKKLVSWLVVVAMILAMVPAVFAAEGTWSDPIDLGSETGDFTFESTGSWSTGYYTWTAPADGTVTLTMTSDNWQYTLSYEDDEDGSSEIIYDCTDEVVVASSSLDVYEGDVIAIWVSGGYDSETSKPAVCTVEFNVSFTEGEVLKATPLKYINLYYNGAQTATVPANGMLKYDLVNFASYEGIFQVTGGASIVYGDTTIEPDAATNMASLTVSTNSATVLLVNDTDVDMEVTLSVYIPEGDQNNPATLKMGDNPVIALNPYGYYHLKWTAEESGTLTPRMADETVLWYYDYAVFSSEDSGYGGYLDSGCSDGFESENSILEVTVEAGNYVEISICNYNATAQNFTLNASFVASETGGDDPETTDATDLVIGNNAINAENVTFAYTASEAGTLNLALGTAIMGEVSVVYTVNDGAESALAQSSNVDLELVAGDVVTVTVSAAGYATLTATWTPATPSGDSGDTTDNTLVLGDNAVSASGLAGGTWTYTATEAGTLNVSVITMVVNGEDVTDGLVYPMYWNANFTLLINEENAYSATGTVEVAVGDTVTVQLYNNMGSAFEATINLSVESDSEDDPAAEGTSTNPYIIDSLPTTITGSLTSENAVDGEFWQYTAEKDGVIIVTAAEGIIVTVFDENGNALSQPVEVSEGDVIVINPWSWGATDYTIDLAYQEEGPEDGGDETPPAEVELEVYVNNAGDLALTYDEVPGLCETWTYVDVFDADATYTIVKDENGFYHLNSVDGPVLLVDVEHIITLDAALHEGRGIMYAYVYENGVLTQKYDIGNAVSEYMAAAAASETGYVPLTDDLIFFYQVYGNNQGWYMEGASIFTVVTTVETDEATETVTEELEFNADNAWMFACLYIAEAHDGSCEECQANAGDNIPETGDNTMLSVAIAAVLVGAMSIVALPMVKKHF